MESIKKVAHDYKLMRSKSEHISEFICKVKSFRENEVETISISRESSGQWLLDEVCERFGGIQEKDYFGLRYTDKEKQRQWLDLGRSVYQQLKESQPIQVSFRLKHYPASPLHDLNQDIACYYLYLQLRRDLFAGRLLGRSADLYQLAAYALQDEAGDYDKLPEESGFLSSMKLLQSLNARTESKIIDLYKNLLGLTSADARQKFLEKACQLDTYGVEPFYVKDQKGNNLYVGLTHEGISTFQGSRRAHSFKWDDINKILFKGKVFIIHVYLDEIYNNQSIKRKHVLGFKCESVQSAEALWKWSNDRMCFFSLNRSSEAKRVKSGGGILKKRKTFKFAGRCQREIQNMSRSMNGLDITDSNNISRRGTLVRTNAMNDEETEELRKKYNTMPIRDKGKMLGTNETLDSLFLGGGSGPNYNIVDNDHVGEHPAHTQNSLDNIVEESNIVPQHTELYLTEVPKDSIDGCGMNTAFGDGDSQSMRLFQQQDTLNVGEKCSKCSSIRSSSHDLHKLTSSSTHVANGNFDSHGDVTAALNELHNVLQRQTISQQHKRSTTTGVDTDSVLAETVTDSRSKCSLLRQILGFAIKCVFLSFLLIILLTFLDGDFLTLPDSQIAVRQRFRRVFSANFISEICQLSNRSYGGIWHLYQSLTTQPIKD